MNILILNWRDIQNPLAGGAEISLFEHAKYWQKKGAVVTWFSASFKNEKALKLENNIKTVRRGSHYTVHLWAFVFFLFGRLGKPDIIIDCFHFLPFFSILYPTKARTISLIHEVAGKLWFLNIHRPFSYFGFWIEPHIIKMYSRTKFITVSNSTKKALVKIGIPQKKISIIHNGFTPINKENVVQKEKKPTILFIGRISADKGIYDALKTFKNIYESNQNVQLWVIGREEKNGAWEKAYNVILKNKELHKQISYFGFVTDEKKYELIKKAWILIHPSQKEGWGLTVIEAASQGVPTIGYKVAGLTDSVKNSKTGILVEANDTYGLADAIIKLIYNKKNYNQISKNAVQWSKQFTWEKSIEKSWEVIQDVYKKNN